MRLLLRFMFFALIIAACKTAEIRVKGTDSKNKNVVLIYKYYSRGFYKEYQFEEKKISTFTDYKKSTPIETRLKSKDWAKTLELLESLDIKKFSSLEAPSNLRKTDKVEFGRLILKIQGSALKSKTFDHGNPPDKIKAIVSHLLHIIDSESINN